MGERDVRIDVDGEHPTVGRHVVGAELTNPAERRVVDQEPDLAVAQMGANLLRSVGLGQIEADAVDFDSVHLGKLDPCLLERRRFV